MAEHRSEITTLAGVWCNGCNMQFPSELAFRQYHNRPPKKERVMRFKPGGNEWFRSRIEDWLVDTARGLDGPTDEEIDDVYDEVYMQGRNDEFEERD